MQSVNLSISLCKVPLWNATVKQFYLVGRIMREVKYSKDICSNYMTDVKSSGDSGSLLDDGLENKCHRCVKRYRIQFWTEN